MSSYVVVAGIIFGLMSALSVINTYLNQMKPEILLRNLVGCFCICGFIIGLIVEGSISKTEITYMFFISGFSLFVFIVLAALIFMKSET